VGVSAPALRSIKTTFTSKKNFEYGKEREEKVYQEIQRRRRKAENRPELSAARMSEMEQRDRRHDLFPLVPSRERGVDCEDIQECPERGRDGGGCGGKCEKVWGKKGEKFQAIRSSLYQFWQRAGSTE